MGWQMRSIETPLKQFFFGFLLISTLGVSFAEEPSPTPSLIAEGAPSLDPLEQGIPNFHIVDGAVFRGGRPSEVGLETLETLKVDTIIDLQGGDIHGHDPILNFFNFLVEPGERKGNILQEQKSALQDGIQHFYNIPLNSNDSVSPKEARKKIGRAHV